MSANLMLKPGSDRSDAVAVSVNDGTLQEDTDIPSNSDSWGVTRIEKALAALSQSLDIDAAVETVSKPSGYESENQSKSGDYQYAHVLQRIGDRLSRLEQTRDSETFQREVNGLRDQLAAKSDRFEQHVEDILSACVRSLKGVAHRLEKIERDRNTIDHDVKSAVKNLQRQLDAEIALTSKTRAQVESLFASVDKQATSLEELHGHTKSLHEAVSSGIKTLNEGFSAVETRIQAKLDERLEQTEVAKNQKLASIDTLLGELVRKTAADNSQRDKALSEFRSALSETDLRVASCEAGTYNILEIEVRHAEAHRDRVKALDEALEEMMSRYNPEGQGVASSS